MMKKTILSLLLLIVGFGLAQAQRFELVTDANEIEEDCRYIFVNSNKAGARAQMMGGNTVDVSLLGVHGIVGTSVTIGDDGIIDLSPSGVIGSIIGGITHPEQCIYTFTDKKSSLLSTTWHVKNYNGLALSTKRDTLGVTDLTQLLGQAQLVEVTDTTTCIDLKVSINKGQVFVNSGETSITDILAAIQALASLKDITENPEVVLEAAKALDPLRYLVASDVGVGSLSITSTFSFNLPLDITTLAEMLKDFSITDLLSITNLIDTNLYLYKEIEEPETFELVTDKSQIAEGEEYIILSAKQMEHGKTATAYSLTTSRKSGLLTTTSLEGLDVAYSKFEVSGAFGRDGQSYVNVRPSVPRFTIGGNDTDGYYVGHDGEVLSAVKATDRDIIFTTDSAFAAMNVDVNAETYALTVDARNKETQKTGIISKKDVKYSLLRFYNKNFSFYSAENDGTHYDIYLYRKAATETIATPVITPESNAGSILGIGRKPFTEPQTVTITCSDERVRIYYTLDGTEPTEKSQLYTEPFIVDGPCTVKAKAYYRVSKSAVASVEYVFKKPAPVLSFTTKGETVLLNATPKAGENINYTVKAQGMNNVTGTLTVDNPSATITTEPYAGEEFYAEATTKADNFDDSDKGTAAFTYTDDAHVTASISFEFLATGTYKNGETVVLKDDANCYHNTVGIKGGLVSKSYPQVKNGELQVGGGQGLIITTARMPYSTVTVQTTSSVKINGTTINPINGLVTWHTEAPVTEVKIETTSTLSSFNTKSIKLTMPKEEEITIGIAKAITYCPANFDVEVPEGVTAYYVDRTSATYIHLAPAGDYIQMGEGVVLAGEPGTYKMRATSTKPEAIDGNYLYGVTEPTYLEQDEAYLLSYKNEQLKFRLNNAGTLAAGKAYLKSSDVAVSANALEILFDFDDEATAVEGIATDNAAGNTVIYNIQGQRVTDSYKGIIIKEGKKLIKK